MNLVRLDLNLLVSLDVLLQERSATNAAAKLGLSQPAVSARLRRHFQDELLARTGNQYRLTPLALQLRDQLRITLGGVERIFAAEPGFDPSSTTREFSMLVSDYSVAVLGSRIGAILAAEAPGCRLRLAANTPRLIDMVEQVLVGIDLVLMPRGFLDNLSYRDLYRDEWVCLVSADNAEVGDELTVRQLETMPWVATYHSPTASTPAARHMRLLGIEPHVQVVTENFLTVPALIAGTGRVALYQQLLVDLIPESVRVRALPCPFPVGPLLEAMWWHPLHDEDPEHRYLREVVVRAVTDLGLPASV
ncbi:LysR family transcriptional regulator [Nocardia sp. alder85J]|uniref:LysR family transcriptional regulator n=1 Tax=Nocardia sp. alder85J TaxID=2862949 RepID=UPI001CD505AB|nr:LysR family transcriptional regulator [Nocardia sp. alder85J]MCX4091603.1 LysR family transcriptional regulator [Nocardia sp. alder85J]